MGAVISIFSLNNHAEFREVVQYSNNLYLTNHMSYARQQQNSEFKLKYFTLNGIELAYVRKGKYEPMRHVNMNKTKVPTVISEENYTFCVYIYDEGHEEQCWIMKALNEKDFQEWIFNLRKAFRPMWVDKAAANCWICDKRFSFYNRQHHCRKCGIAVCNDCSPFKIKWVDLGYPKAVRTCTKCSGFDQSILSLQLEDRNYTAEIINNSKNK